MVFSLADEVTKLLFRELNGGFTTEEKIDHFFFRNEMINLVQKALSKEQPVEGFVGDEIAIIPAVIALLSYSPQPDSLKESNIPVLSLGDGLP